VDPLHALVLRVFGQRSAGGLSVQCLTGPTIAKKMRPMKQIDRRITVAPMMDWTD